jgi:hypothetical protein
MKYSDRSNYLVPQFKKETKQDMHKKDSDLDQTQIKNQKLKELAKNYEFIENELFKHKKSKISSSSSPLRMDSKIPDQNQSDLSLGEVDKTSSYQYHLVQMQNLQKKAKEMLEKEFLAKMKKIDEVPVLNEKFLRKKRQEHVESKIPMYVLMSSVRKDKKLPPRFVNQSLSSGEVMPIYVLGDPSPRYDPLVKVEQHIPSQSLQYEYRDSVDATAHSYHDEGGSLLYYKIYKSSKKPKVYESFTPEPSNSLVEPPATKNLRPITPTGMPYAWMFRELEPDKKKINPKRKWVSQRMNEYYKLRVKKDFLPKIDANKSLEIELNKEKKNFRMRSFPRVRLV